MELRANLRKSSQRIFDAKVRGLYTVGPYLARKPKWELAEARCI